MLLVKANGERLPEDGEHMTPENDVKKDTDQDSTGNSEAELTEDSQKPQNGHDSAASESEAPAASEKPTTDFADKAADALRNLNSSNDGSSDEGEGGDEGGDEIDQAANAQAQSEEASTDSAADEDPLGFLDKNSDGSVDNPDDDIAGLQSQLEDAKAQITAHQEQLLRVQAEMENQRKRAQNDVTKAHKFALEKIALDLLPVKDSLEMGLEAATGEDAEPSKIIEGSELTLKMLSQALEKYNIIEINPLDEKFDPEFHQAMTMQPVEGKEPNTVAGVMQKGYTLNERLIRPALVMVAK